MPTLRSKVIRLAHAHPELRPHLLPILTKTAQTFEEAVKGKTFTNPDTGNKVQFSSLPSEEQSKIRGQWKKEDNGNGKKEEGEPKKESKPLPSVPKDIQEAFTADEQKLPKAAAQKSKDIDDIYKEAEVAHGHQLKLLNQGEGLDKVLGATVVRGDKGEKPDLDKPGPVVMIGPQKKRDRVKEKAKADGKEVDSVLDIVRATVALDKADDIPGVMKSLREMGMEIARQPKNRFANPTDVGYRDLMFNVRYPNGHIGEIQINLKSMIKAKDVGHKHYEKVRSIEAKKKEEGDRKLTDEEAAEVEKAMKAQRELYDGAWREAMGEKPGKGSKTAGRIAAGDKYYEWHDKPVRMKVKELPVAINFKGDEVVVYDLETFFHEATPITKAAYNILIQAMLGKDDKKKQASLRSRTIRLAAENPDLRPILLPILSKSAAKDYDKMTTQELFQAIEEAGKKAKAHYEKVRESKKVREALIEALEKFGK